MGAEDQVFGRHERTLDDKGRLVLPSIVRGALGDTAFLVRLDGCIGIWNRGQFDTASERVRDSVRLGVAPKNAMRAFFARVFQVAIDSQGRVLIPAELRSDVGLEREVVITGQKSHVELWEPGRWAEITTEVEEQFDFTDAVMDLGLGI